MGTVSKGSKYEKEIAAVKKKYPSQWADFSRTGTDIPVDHGTYFAKGESSALSFRFHKKSGRITSVMKKSKGLAATKAKSAATKPKKEGVVVWGKYGTTEIDMMAWTAHNRIDGTWYRGASKAELAAIIKTASKKTPTSAQWVKINEKLREKGIVIKQDIDAKGKPVSTYFQSEKYSIIAR